MRTSDVAAKSTHFLKSVLQNASKRGVRVGHWLQIAVTVLLQYSIILSLVTSPSTHGLKWGGPYSFAPHPVEKPFARLATQTVVTRPAASALWAAC